MPSLVNTHSFPKSLFSTLTTLGLTTNLKLCLDAGDAESTPASATSWLDRSGNGYDFFRGTTSGADATDPTFNGTVGNVSLNEYWSFDGGDFFRYDTTNETWMENLHKDNAKFTVCAWMYFNAAGVNNRILGTRGATGGGRTGVSLFKGSTDVFAVNVENAGVVALTAAAIGAVPIGQWAFFAISLDEAVGASGILWQVNTSTDTDTSTYTSPSSGSASFTLELGAGGNADSPLSSGGRMGQMGVWEGTAFTAAQLDAVFQATRGRYGV